ncbi:MAG: zf-HC2 domain-containing protein [Vicinamibacterales bacterium]
MTDTVSPACAAVLGGISGYLDGELASTECDAIEQHCQTCASCMAVVAGLRETIGLCRGAVVAELPDAVRQKAQDSVAQLLKNGHL